MNYTVLIIVGFIILFMAYAILKAKQMKNLPPVVDNSKIVHLNDKNFKQTTQNSIALIDFWAEWCMPCKMMAPILNEVANEVDGKVKICKLNVEHEQALASKFSVKGIPTLVLLKNGKEVNRFVGIKQKDFLLKEINNLLN